MSGSSSPPVPTAAQRKDCYRARDNYYKCLAENDGKNAAGDSSMSCNDLKKIYDSVCLPSWVKYFERKRVFDQYKAKVQEEGYQEKQ